MEIDVFVSMYRWDHRYHYIAKTKKEKLPIFRNRSNVKALSLVRNTTKNNISNSCYGGSKLSVLIPTCNHKFQQVLVIAVLDWDDGPDNHIVRRSQLLHQIYKFM